MLMNSSPITLRGGGGEERAIRCWGGTVRWRTGAAPATRPVRATGRRRTRGDGVAARHVARRIKKETGWAPARPTPRPPAPSVV